MQEEHKQQSELFVESNLFVEQLTVLIFDIHSQGHQYKIKNQKTKKQKTTTIYNNKPWVDA
tara:strand:- start:700 stop:882 length:183 start_codon:yes stop_codon:yes gene_type:complete